MVGLDQNRWRIKIFSPKYSFKKIGEGEVDKKRVKKIREQMPSLKHRKNKLFSN